MAHCHAAKGEAMSGPWTSTPIRSHLQPHEEAGIDTDDHLPIENPTYDRANEEIARLVARYPGKFIGFAKHDPWPRRAGSGGCCTARYASWTAGLKAHKTPTREVVSTPSPS